MQYNPLTGAGQQGVSGGQGLNNIGLLVTVFGRVTWVDESSNAFTLSDGSSWAPQALLDALGHAGVRVESPGGLPAGLAPGQFVTATGASSCYTSVGAPYPRVLVPEPGGIHTAEP